MPYARLKLITFFMNEEPIIRIKSIRVVDIGRPYSPQNVIVQGVAVFVALEWGALYSGCLRERGQRRNEA